MTLTNKCIVITGTSSGIGERTAQLALYAGAQVIGIDRKPGALALTQFIQADLSQPDSIAQAIAQLPSGIDGLVNNAGVSGEAGAAKVLAINYLGLRALTLGLADKLREGASIVNVASVAGFGWRDNLAQARSVMQVPGFPDAAQTAQEHGVTDANCYPLSKEVLRLWTKKQAHSADFKSRGIRINTVSPGPVETPILAEFVACLGEEKVSADVSKVGRAGRPSDIAPAILFLLSDAARWVNGANIPVDGGLEAALFAETLEF